MQEFEESWYSLCPAARREHVVRQMVTVIIRLGVMPQKDLNVMPRIRAVSVSVVLSGTGKRNILPDPRSTLPNTQ